MTEPCTCGVLFDPQCPNEWHRIEANNQDPSMVRVLYKLMQFVALKRGWEIRGLRLVQAA